MLENLSGTAVGVAQCGNYITDIEQKAESVATGKGFFKEMPSLMPNLRVVLSGKHYIFCLPQQNAPALGYFARKNGRCGKAETQTLIITGQWDFLTGAEAVEVLRRTLVGQV